MEFANETDEWGSPATAVRQAQSADSGKIMRLLQTAPWQHVHVDWHLPGDWLGQPGFVVKTRPSHLKAEPEIVACLAAFPDPLPAAWVRAAAFLSDARPRQNLVVLLEAVIPWLQAAGVTQLGWLAIDSWPNRFLPGLGFRQANEIEVYVKEDTAVPPTAPIPDLIIRPVSHHDFEPLAAMEAKAFAPLWRHSSQALRKAQSQAYSFDVVQIAGETVGYQVSTRSQHGVHLARMTIDPKWQHQGVGSLLLTHTLQGYYRRGYYRVTLNTQVDNLASQKLYKKFGFTRQGNRIPVWVLGL